MTAFPTQAAPRTTSPRYTIKSAILVLVLLLTLFASISLVVAGHFSVDEAAYHMMLRSFSSGGSLSVWNGYEEFPSPELVLPMLRVHDGRLFSQYPHFTAILATPLYWLAGYQGLYILNAVSFIAAVGLSFLMARALFQNRGLAIDACLLLIFGGFAWQYSQAAWPHALSMLFVTGAVYLTVTALRSPASRRSLALATAAGLVAGFGTGVRLDVVFALPAVLLPFVFAVPWRPSHAVAACVGTVPGLALLAVTNLVKFGIAMPFSYGVAGSGAASGPLPYLPVVLLGFAVVAAAWLARGSRGRSWLASHRWSAGLIVALLLVALGLTPLGWHIISKFANGLYQLVVDLRIRDPGLSEPALLRSPGGGMVYRGTLKKALLQSCPYLTVLILPLSALLRGSKDSAAVAQLCLVPAAYIGVYSYFAWHGGQAFNLRYFLPILPFTSILTAYAWRELRRDLTRAWRRIAVVAGAAAVACFLIFVPRSLATIAHQEIAFLTVPLVIAVATFILVAACVHLGATAGPNLRGAASATLAVGLVWAVMVGLLYDATRAYDWRKKQVEFAREIVPFVEPNSIVFVPHGSYFFSLLEQPQVRLAVPSLDDYRDFRALVDYHLESGHPVYLSLDRRFAATVEERDLLRALQTQPLHEHRLGVLVRVVVPHEVAPGS